MRTVIKLETGGRRNSTFGHNFRAAPSGRAPERRRGDAETGGQAASRDDDDADAEVDCGAATDGDRGQCVELVILKRAVQPQMNTDGHGFAADCRANPPHPQGERLRRGLHQCLSVSICGYIV